MRNIEIIEICARAAHEVNRVYCIAVGNTSCPSWDYAPGWQKDIARNGATEVLAGNTPEQRHAAWMADKVASGWTYGPVKDPDAKQHPHMVAYADLPAIQRAKDSLFTSTVRCMAASLGAKVRYPPLPGYPAHTIDWSTGEDVRDVENDTKGDIA